MSLLSVSCKPWWPYRYKITSSARCGNLLVARISNNVIFKSVLGVGKRPQVNRNCLVYSVAHQQSHKSMELWCHLLHLEDVIALATEILLDLMDKELQTQV